MSHFRFILFGLLTLCLSACPTIAPTITVQPRSLTVIVGSTATFSVTATGSKPFIYSVAKKQSGSSPKRPRENIAWLLLELPRFTAARA